MGRIVKGAQFVTERYRLSIPAVAVEKSAPVADVDPLVPGEAPADATSVEADERQAPAVAVVDLQAVAQEADALIERGRQSAEQLVLAAQTQAKQLLAQAATGAAQVQSQARAEGLVQGQEAGRAEAAEQAREAIATLRELIESARVERRTIVDGAESELVKLALAIAERIVHREIEVAPDVVIGMVHVGLSRLSGRESVTIRVNPGDAVTIREHREVLLAAGDVEGVRIVEDQRVDRGGVVIETESGTIDAKIGTQLREARRLFSPDEPIALPSSDEGLLHSSAQAS